VDRDYIMDAQQAVAYGIIDRVISRREMSGNAPMYNGNRLNGSGH